MIDTIILKCGEKPAVLGPAAEAMVNMGALVSDLADIRAEEQGGYAEFRALFWLRITASHRRRW